MQLEDLKPRPDLNVRKTNPSDGVEELAAKIKATGLIEPIVVRPLGDGTAEIIDGARRYAAIKLLESQGIYVELHVVEREVDDDEAFELSLIANAHRQLHPVDEYEAIVRLFKTRTIDDVADRLGLTPQQVRQRLALGDLDAAILDAWRAGSIDESTARAFTLARSKGQQRDILNDLVGKRWVVNANNVRSALGIDLSLADALEVVGRQAYEDAGGTMTEDLFGGIPVVHDGDLLKSILAGKLKAQCEALIADGWAWARIKSEVANPWNFSRQRPSGKTKATADQESELAAIKKELEDLQEIAESHDEGLTDELNDRWEVLQDRETAIKEEVDAAAWGPRQKKGLGCFVAVERGRIVIERGLLDPKAAAAASREGGKSEKGGPKASAPEPGDDISKAMTLALTEQLTAAVADVFSNNPRLALAAAIVGLESIIGGPVKISTNGFVARESAARLDYGEALREALALDVSDALARLADAVKCGVDLRRHDGGDHDGRVKDLLRVIGAQELTAAAAKHFDPEHYFGGVSAGVCNAALDEMGADKRGRPAKKRDLVALCIETYKGQSGWVPPLMRAPR